MSKILYTELKPCPFCGCSVTVNRYKHPSGATANHVSGWHDDGCILQWLTIEPVDDDDNPLPPEEIAERWNRRWKEP